MSLPIKLPADHAIDYLVDLLEAAFPNQLPSVPSMDAYWRRVGERAVVDYLRSLQKAREDLPYQDP